MFQTKADVNYKRAHATKVRFYMPFQTDRLKKMRLDRRLTQAHMAKELNATQPQYADWERGRFPPRAEVVAKMAQALSVTIDYLYGLVENPDETLKEEGLNDLELQIIRELRKDDIKLYYVAKLLDLPVPPPALPAPNEGNNESKVSGND